MQLGIALAEALADTVKTATSTARVTTASNVLLWSGAVQTVDVAVDGGFILQTVFEPAVANGTPAKVKFYDSNNIYQWQTTIGNGPTFDFQFTGNIESGRSYNFTSSSVSFPSSTEN